MALGRFGALVITSYNGVDLSANETVRTTDYRVTPVYDSARRTVKWCRFNIGLRFDVYDVTGSSRIVQDMVGKLTKSGGELQYAFRGTGFEERVNRGRVKDVDHGPRPGEVRVRPRGGRVGVQVDWSVEFTIPTCDDAVFDGIAEWCYTVSESVDAERVTTRTTNGHLIIANGRIAPGARATRDSANRYLEDVWPPIPAGFELLDNSHETSEDRSTLTYTQVVRERGAAPGLNILAQSGDESMTTDPGNPCAHIRRISWKYTIRPDRSAKAAFDHFLPLVQDRLKRAAEIPGAQVLFAGFDARTGDPHRPRQQVSLSISFRVVGASISQVLGQTGMWQPVPNSNDRLWRATVEDVLGPRGKANLIFDPKADKIVDLCRASDVPTAPAKPEPSKDTVIDLRNIPDLLPKPKPDASWLLYDVAIRTVIDTGRIVTKLLPEKSLTQADLRTSPPAFATGGSLGSFVTGAIAGVIAGASKLPRIAKEPGGSLAGEFGERDTEVQQRTTATVYVNVTGRALRHGYPIPHPEVTSIDGHEATLITRGEPGEGFVTGVVGHNVLPVFGARFSLWYVVPGLSRAVTPGQPVPKL